MQESRRLLMLAQAVLTVSLAGSASATTYVWTQTGTGGNWSSATWTGGTPVESAADGSNPTTIQFYAGTSGASNTVSANFSANLDSGVTSTVSGGAAANSFDLQSLTLNGTGAFTVTLASAAGGPYSLNFTGAANTVTNNAAAGGLAYTISTNVSFANGLTISGTGATTFSGALSGSGGLTKSGNGAVSLSSGNKTFSGGLRITAGRLTLTGSSAAYTGGTAIDGGSLIANSNSPFSSGTITFGGGNLTYGGTTSGAGEVRTISNPLVFNANAQLIDSVNIQGGADLSLTGATVDLGGATRVLTTDNSIATAAISTLVTTMSGVVSNGGLTKSGRGILLLTGANTYTGDTIVRQGTLVLGGNAPVDANGTLGKATTAIQLGDSTNNTAQTVGLLTDGAFTIARDIVINPTNATGQTIIGGANVPSTAKLATAITPGGTVSGTAVFSGSITLGSSGTAHGVTLTSALGVNGASTHFSGVIQDPAGLAGPGGLVTVAGAQAAGSSYSSASVYRLGTVKITGANTFTGGMNISGDATVDIADTNQSVGFLSNALSAPTLTSGGTGYASTPTVTISGGGGTGATATVIRTGSAITGIYITNYGSGYTSAPTFTLSAGNAQITGNFAASEFKLGSGTLAIKGVNAADASYNGVISGAGAVVKEGTGNQILTAASTYTGSTTIKAGRLTLTGSGSLGNSSTLLVGDTAAHSSATFDVAGVTGGFHVAANQTLAGHGLVVGAVTLDQDATLSPGNSTGVLTIDGDLTLAAGSLSAFEVTDWSTLDKVLQGSSGEQVTFGGTLNVNFGGGFATPGQATIFNFSQYAGGFTSFGATGLADGAVATFDPATGVLAVSVPEPNTIALAAAVGGLGILSRRRRLA